MPIPCRPNLLGCIILMSLSTAVQTFAQPQAPRVGHRDPMQEHLFPPELVMAHQREIGLDTDQRQRLIAEVQSLQTEMVPLQFEMKELVENLSGLLAEAAVDETAALELAESIMGLESQIKRRHLTLLIRTKNLLSAEQQSRLLSLRSKT